MIIGVDSGNGKDWTAHQFKCRRCGDWATKRIQSADYFRQWEYYCTKCAEEQTMEYKR